MSEWIDIKEQLPDENVDVLVYEPDFGLCIAWLDDGDFYALGVNFVEPSHWMPLPAPPKKE